jgi:predicted DNA-binding protein (MmcQ/YjbR family)
MHGLTGGSWKRSLRLPRQLPTLLKCDPGLAIQLRTSYPSITGGYHLNKRHWNTVVLDGSVPDQLLRDMIEDSYDLVVAGLPLAQRERLGWVALSRER